MVVAVGPGEVVGDADRLDEVARAAKEDGGEPVGGIIDGVVTPPEESWTSVRLPTAS
jgi:hypothetical protein